MNPQFKVLDLFAGIGGFSLGLERTGHFKTVAFCEIDNYCQRVLHKHWPEVYIHSDIRTLTAKHFDGWERPDVIAGGFPCQDISCAGDGAGISEGTRSGLWIEYSRLIRELRPKYVIVENVAALLGRGISRVLGDLAESGYDAEWDCIPASAVGAHHQRDRVWIVAYPGCARLHQRGEHSDAGKESELSHGTGSHGVQGQHEIQGEVLADSYRAGLEGRVFGSERASEWLTRTRSESKQGIWQSESTVGRVAHGIPNRVQRLKCLGNSIVPQIATWIGNRIVEASA